MLNCRMVFKPIIFALNYCKRNYGGVFFVSEVFIFEEYFIMFEKTVHKREKKNSENLYMEEKDYIKTMP